MTTVYRVVSTDPAFPDPNCPEFTSAVAAESAAAHFEYMCHHQHFYTVAPVRVYESYADWMESAKEGVENWD